jgi:hypothetical protein
MKDKRMFITLDSMQFNDDKEIMLVKQVDSIYLEKTVYDNIQKLLDPKSDALNKTYNPIEKNTAKIVTDWFKTSNTYMDVITNVYGFIEEGMLFELKINDQLSKYDSIINYKEFPCKETNPGEKIILVDFLISQIRGSG